MTKQENPSNPNMDYGVDSRYTSKKDRETDAVALMQARLERMKMLPKEQIIQAKLIQLKLRMENYLKEPVHKEHDHFSQFLKSYVDILYGKRSEFANDINAKPVFLSQVINRHREPSEELMMKLMIHSEKVFNQVCDFQKKIWYEVYLHGKLSDAMASLDKCRPEIEKQVRFTPFA